MIEAAYSKKATVFLVSGARAIVSASAERSSRRLEGRTKFQSDRLVPLPPGYGAARSIYGAVCVPICASSNIHKCSRRSGIANSGREGRSPAHGPGGVLLRRSAEAMRSRRLFGSERGEVAVEVHRRVAELFCGRGRRSAAAEPTDDAARPAPGAPAVSYGCSRGRSRACKNAAAPAPGRRSSRFLRGGLRHARQLRSGTGWDGARRRARRTRSQMKVRG
jgi:hypothetical protein